MYNFVPLVKKKKKLKYRNRTTWHQTENNNNNNIEKKKILLTLLEDARHHAYLATRNLEIKLYIYENLQSFLFLCFVVDVPFSFVVLRIFTSFFSLPLFFRLLWIYSGDRVASFKFERIYNKCLTILMEYIKYFFFFKFLV